MWNRAYYEARVPGVPTMLLELLVSPEFRRHAPGARPAVQVPREPGGLQGYPALYQLAIRFTLCSAAAAGRGFRRGIHRRRRGCALVESGDGPARSDRRADGLCGLHARGRRRFRQRPLCRQTPPDRPAGAGTHVQPTGSRPSTRAARAFRARRLRPAACPTKRAAC